MFLLLALRENEALRFIDGDLTWEVLKVQEK